MSRSTGANVATLRRASVLDGHPRYRDDWIEPFHAAAVAVLRPGSVVLDVGGGRRPAIPRSMLPPEVRYVGLDLSRRELEEAPPGAYDELIEGDVCDRIPGLDAAVDLVVTWQVLEHVRSMAAALGNVHAWLRPGGRLVAQLSGGLALFAVLNRLVPHRIAATGMRLVLGRDPGTVFPAPYDGCTYSELRQLLAGWRRATIVPRFRGAQYFAFSGLLQRAYLAAEDSMVRGRHLDLATHYLVVADR